MKIHVCYKIQNMVMCILVLVFCNVFINFANTWRTNVEKLFLSSL